MKFANHWDAGIAQGTDQVMGAQVRAAGALDRTEQGQWPASEKVMVANKAYGWPSREFLKCLFWVGVIIWANASYDDWLWSGQPFAIPRH